MWHAQFALCEVHPIPHPQGVHSYHEVTSLALALLPVVAHTQAACVTFPRIQQGFVACRPEGHTHASSLRRI